MRLEKIYVSRITEVAQRYPDSVTLTAKPGSGKKLVLKVVVPGVIDKCVLRLPRKLHKRFYEVVAVAKRWLEGFKKLFATAIQPMVAVVSDAQKLVAAAANIKRETQPTGKTKLGKDGAGKVKGTMLANSYYHGNDVYTRTLTEMRQILEAERGGI